MTTNPTENNFAVPSIARRFGALTYLIVLVTAIPIFVVTIVWVITVTIDFGAIWGGLQSMWFAAYSWAGQQPIFLQVAIGIGLFFIGLPLAIAILAWTGFLVFGGVFFGVGFYLLVLNREARILQGRSEDDWSRLTGRL